MLHDEETKERLVAYYFKILSDNYHWITPKDKKALSYLFLSVNKEKYATNNKTFKAIITKGLDVFFSNIDTTLISPRTLHDIYFNIELTIRSKLTYNPSLFDPDFFMYSEATKNDEIDPKIYRRYMFEKYHSRLAQKISYPSDYLDDLITEEEPPNYIPKLRYLKILKTSILVPFTGIDANNNLIVTAYQNIYWLDKIISIKKKYKTCYQITNIIDYSIVNRGKLINLLKLITKKVHQQKCYACLITKRISNRRNFDYDFSEGLDDFIIEMYKEGNKKINKKVKKEVKKEEKNLVSKIIGKKLYYDK